MILALPFLGRCSQLFVFHTRLVNGVHKTYGCPRQLLHTIELGSRNLQNHVRVFRVGRFFDPRSTIPWSLLTIVCVPYSASEWGS